VHIWLKQIVVWIAANFGKDLVVAAKIGFNTNGEVFFASRNILVLGSKQTGKDLAIRLAPGRFRPFEVVDGEIEPKSLRPQ